ncbi:MAG TPA: gliding motility-associated C-terminal domain-containing protein [Bacteroidetes bacterium]|nr:gliding motility-associated C-terminal domain-containing protein [Bacteroidota bacterium]
MKRPLFLALVFPLFLLCLHPAAGQSQCPTGKEGNIWYFGAYFGDPAGLDFGAGSPPAFLDDSAIPPSIGGYEAYAIANGGDGSLLFYSNGLDVWNRNHEPMQGNGFGIGGHSSATQMVALPQPGHPGTYYLFYPETRDLNPQLDTVADMLYAVVDMQLDGGLGGIVQKKVFLHGKTTEKVAAARHCNGEDWWVLTHELGSNRFFAWLLDSSGIAASPVVSEAGAGNSGLRATKGGQMKISPDGQRVAMAETGEATFWGVATYDAHTEVFRFDNATGEVYDPVLMRDSLRSAYGAEFSPDNGKVYFEVWDPDDRIIQYDLKAGSADAIIQSRTVVAENNVTNGAGGMLLGPDGKIYIANVNYFGTPQKSLDAIHRPNEKGAACDYRGGADGLLLPDNVGVGLGLPDFPASYFAPLKPWLEGPGQVCAGAEGHFYVTGNCAAVDYLWEVPGGGIVREEGDSVWVEFGVPGVQEVVVHRTTACATWSDTLAVIVEESLINTDTLYICPGDSVEVSGEWVGQPGTFTQGFTSVNGCDSTSTTVVVLLPGNDTALVASTTCDPAGAGTFVQSFPGQNGCDSTVVTTVTFSPADTFEVFSATCDPTAAGVFTSHFNNQSGCDSVVVETVDLLPGDSVFIYSSTCAAAAAGIFTDHLTNQWGCDSVVVETVDFLPGDSTFIYSTTCDPELAGAGFSVFNTPSGCDSVVVRVTTLATPLTVDLGEDLYIMAGDTTTVEAIVNLPPDSLASVVWSPSGCPACLVQAVSPPVTTAYFVDITALNGCSAEDEVTVFVEAVGGQVYVPNSFSPNGDGINDFFTIYGKGDAQVHWLRIFSRWGEKVYEGGNFAANGRGQGWDGRHRGQLMEPGVFVWLAEIVLADGDRRVLEGEVVLLR